MKIQQLLTIIAIILQYNNYFPLWLIKTYEQPPLGACAKVCLGLVQGIHPEKLLNFALVVDLKASLWGVYFSSGFQFRDGNCRENLCNFLSENVISRRNVAQNFPVPKLKTRRSLTGFLFTRRKVGSSLWAENYPNFLPGRKKNFSFFSGKGISGKNLLLLMNTIRI
jgi:hypothetical protein